MISIIAIDIVAAAAGAGGALIMARLKGLR